MRTSEKLENITKSLIDFQLACPTLTKDREGYGYKYTTLDNIINVCKPLLAKFGMVIVQSVGAHESGVTITTRLQHISGEYFEDSFSLGATTMKNVNNVQAMGASITYGKRYGISAMLNISVDDDTDGVHEQKPQQTPAKHPIVNPLDIEIMKLLTTNKMPDKCENWKQFPDSRKIDMINYIKGQSK